METEIKIKEEGEEALPDKEESIRREEGQGDKQQTKKKHTEAHQSLRTATSRWSFPSQEFN